MSVPTMTLDDEMPQRHRFHGREDYYDDIGFAVVAESGDFDILMGEFFYVFQGGPSRPKSQWLGDGVANNSLHIIIPKERRGKGLSNNNFHRVGMNLPQYYQHEDLKVDRDADSVTWSLGDIRYICRPPEWELRGRHGEAEYDLTFHQLPHPVVWSYGTFREAENNGLGAGYCYLSVEGSLKVAGKTYTIHNGRGVHERLAFSESPVLDMAVVPPKHDTGDGGGFAIHGLHGDVLVWMLGRPDDPMAFITVDGKQISYLPGQGQGTVSYATTERWFDPRTGMYVPSQWHVSCASPDGVLDLDITGHGRGFYPWEMKRGYQVMLWILGVANGAFYTPDGRTIPITNQLVQHEVVKNIMVHTETMAGPDLTPSW